MELFELFLFSTSYTLKTKYASKSIRAKKLVRTDTRNILRTELFLKYCYAVHVAAESKGGTN